MTTPDEQFLTGPDLPGGQFPGGRDSGPDSDGQPSIGDLTLAGPSASPAEVRNALRAQMGEDVPRAPRPPRYPDVHGLAEDLGLA